MEEGRRAFKILTAKPTGKRLLGMSRRRWEDNYTIMKVRKVTKISVNTRNRIN